MYSRRHKVWKALFIPELHYSDIMKIVETERAILPLLNLYKG